MLIIGKIFEGMKVISSQYTAKSPWILPCILNSINKITQMLWFEKQQEKWCRVVVGQEDALCLHLYLCPASTPGYLEDSGSLNPYFLLSVFSCFPGFPAALMMLPSPPPSAPSAGLNIVGWDAVHWVLTESLNHFVMAPAVLLAKIFLPGIHCNSEGCKCIAAVSQL